MNRRSILTKTGKGLMEVTGKTSALSRDLRNILKEIDGKVSVSELMQKFAKMTEPELLEALRSMEREGYLREFVGKQEDASRPPIPRTPTAPSPADGGEDLDFTAFTPAKPSAKTNEDARLQSQAQEIARQAQAMRAREEAAAKARAEAAARARAEAEHKARLSARAGLSAQADPRADDAQAKAQTDALDQARREAEERQRREAEEKARREAVTRAVIEAEQAAKREAEERVRREIEERTRRETEERARHEGEARTRREAEEKVKRDAEERVRRETEERARREIEERARREEAGRRRGPRFQGSLAFRPGALGEEKARRPREAVCGDVAPDPDRRGCRAPLRPLGIQFVRKGGAGVARGAGQDRHRQPDSAPDPAAEVRESRDRQRARDARGRDQGRPGDHFPAGGADVAQELRAGRRALPAGISPRAAAEQGHARLFRRPTRSGQGAEDRHPRTGPAGAGRGRESCSGRRVEVGCDFQRRAQAFGEAAASGWEGGHRNLLGQLPPAHRSGSGSQRVSGEGHRDEGRARVERGRGARVRRAAARHRKPQMVGRLEHGRGAHGAPDGGGQDRRAAHRRRDAAGQGRVLHEGTSPGQIDPERPARGQFHDTEGVDHQRRHDAAAPGQRLGRRDDSLFRDERWRIGRRQSHRRSPGQNGGRPVDRHGTGRNGSPEKPVRAYADRDSRADRAGARDAHAQRHLAESPISPQQLS